MLARAASCGSQESAIPVSSMRALDTMPTLSNALIFACSASRILELMGPLGLELGAVEPGGVAHHGRLCLSCALEVITIPAAWACRLGVPPLPCSSLDQRRASCPLDPGRLPIRPGLGIRRRRVIVDDIIVAICNSIIVIAERRLLALAVRRQSPRTKWPVMWQQSNCYTSCSRIGLCIVEEGSL